MSAQQPEALNEDNDRDLGFGNRLKEARTRARMSQAAVGGAINVSTQSIWNYENRGDWMSAKNAFIVADLLDVSARWLVTGVEDGSRPPPPAIMGEANPRIRQSAACLQAFLAQDQPSTELVQAALTILLGAMPASDEA